MARETAEDRGTAVQERRGVERAEAAISQSPTSASPFLAQLNEITGPNSTAGAGNRAVAQMDRDGFAGRATALEAQQILDATKGTGVSGVAGWLTGGRIGTAQEITRADIENYKHRPEISRGEYALSERLLKNFNTISGDGQKITPANIASFEAREQQHSDMRNLYAKDKPGSNGRSLYDSVKSDTGGISGEKLDARLKDPSLSAANRASLEATNKLRATSWGTPTGDVSSGALRQAADTAGVTQQERQGTLKRAEPRSAEAQAGTAAMQDLTAKPGGGPSLYDRTKDDQGGISSTKLQTLMRDPLRNNLTPENRKTLNYLNEHRPIDTQSSAMAGVPVYGDYTKTDLQKLGADSGVNWDKLSGRPQTTRLDDSAKGRQQDMAHLFEKTDGRPSLYERLNSPDGSITQSSINAELAKSPNPRDRHTLDYMKDLSANGIFSKYNLSAQELATKAHDHGISDRTIARGGLDPRVADKVTSPAASGDVSTAVHQALTVRGGEGYYHSAERLLSEAHKGQKYDPTQQELKTLVAQLKQANGGRTELRAKEELKLSPEIWKNPDLAGLLKKV